MRIDYDEGLGLFLWSGPFEQRDAPEEAGFRWNSQIKRWSTADLYTAYRLAVGARVTPAAVERLRPVRDNLARSAAAEDPPDLAPIPAPPGRRYRAYQRAGIRGLADRPAALLADEQGLGKTIQVVGLANLLGLSRILVVCPASLRLNWAREITAWHLHSLSCAALLSGRDEVPAEDPVVVSYDLVTGAFYDALVSQRWEMIVVDEAHYIKNSDAARTQMLLGLGQHTPLVNQAERRLFLTGTPVPNRPTEFFALLKTQAPGLIGNVGFWRFARRYAYVVGNGPGRQIKGARNQEDLRTRLRGSGFMVRRLKQDVLRELPPKQHKLVLFPADQKTRRVLKKESDFSAAEIIEHGEPVGSALPEIRREMGEALAPSAVAYVRDLLEEVEKVVVFAHHVSVVERLSAGLAEYGCVEIVGKTPGKKRQANVDAFQSDPEVRVLVGHLISAGTGWTLTASSDVVFAEASWVPGENDQAVDRTHRIGQANSVTAHFLVVEGSISAAVLSSALRKKEDCKPITDEVTR